MGCPNSPTQIHRHVCALLKDRGPTPFRLNQLAGRVVAERASGLEVDVAMTRGAVNCILIWRGPRVTVEHAVVVSA